MFTFSFLVCFGWSVQHWWHQSVWNSRVMSSLPISVRFWLLGPSPPPAPSPQHVLSRALTILCRILLISLSISTPDPQPSAPGNLHILTALHLAQHKMSTQEIVIKCLPKKKIFSKKFKRFLKFLFQYDWVSSNWPIFLQKTTINSECTHIKKFLGPLGFTGELYQTFKKKWQHCHTSSFRK